MSSKLDPYFNELFDQLNEQGKSYRSVCGNLLMMGVEISPQSLRSWHVRRMRKITSRSQTSGEMATAPLPIVRAIQNKLATDRPSNGEIPISHKVSDLRNKIAQEESLHAAKPSFALANSFPVKRKK